MEEIRSQWKDILVISYLSIFRKSVEGIQVSLRYDKNRGDLHEDLTTLIIYLPVLLRTSNISEKVYGQTQNIHFVFSNFFF